MSTETKVYENQPSFAVYRANKDKNGAACRFTLAPAKENRGPSLFLDMAKQTGEDENQNASFGWRRWNKESRAWDNTDKCVSVKLGTADIGELLAVISGRKDAAGSNGKSIFHTNDKGTSTIDFKLYGKQNEPPTTFMLSTSAKLNEGKEAVRISHSLSFAEGEALRVFLERALVAVNNW